MPSRTTQTSNGLAVTLSEPVLVRRSRRYCWFPALIRQPDGTLWASMSAYADEHVSSAICYLTRSRDGGQTWDEPRIIGDAGQVHVVADDGTAIILPYYLRPRGADVIGAPCNVIAPDGTLAMRAPGVTVSGWPRRPGTLDGLGTAAFVFNGKVLRGRHGEYLTTLYGHFAGDTRYALVLAESADGFDWRIRAVIAGSDCSLDGAEGPCEACLCRLPDGSLQCVFRLDSFKEFGVSFSADDGHAWTPAVNLPGVFSVEPRLETLPGGIIALSGGRPGVYVWLNVDGGEGRQAVDIVAHHNACRPDDAIEPDIRNGGWMALDELLRTGRRGFTSCYTDLAVLDDRTLLLIYDRVGLGWHAIPDESDETNSVWVVHLTVEKEA